MLPPSKRFKMENSVPVHQNGIETPKKVGTPVTPVTSVTLKPCSVSVPPLVVPAGSRLLSTTASSSPSPSSSSPTSIKTSSILAPPTVTTMELTQEAPGSEGEPMDTSAQVVSLQAGQGGSTEDQVLSTSDIAAQMKELEKALGSRSEPAAERQQTLPCSQPAPQCSSTQTSATSLPQQSEPAQAVTGAVVACEAKGLQEGQEIYIQTEGLTMQLAEPGSDQIVIVNGPDGTTMRIRTPEGVPLEAVHALLGIEASEGGRAPQ